MTEQPGRTNRWTLAVVAVALVLVIVGGGVALQAWRTSRAPSAVPGATAGPAGLTPASITSGSPIRFGQTGAPVTITMYADFHCPHCVDLEEEIGPTLTAAQQSGRVTLELYPMAFIDAGSTAASNAVACAAEAGFGEPYYRGLFANSALKWTASGHPTTRPCMFSIPSAVFRRNPPICSWGIPARRCAFSRRWWLRATAAIASTVCHACASAPLRSYSMG